LHAKHLRNGLARAYNVANKMGHKVA
jgi:hypothetical protein